MANKLLSIEGGKEAKALVVKYLDLFCVWIGGRNRIWTKNNAKKGATDIRAKMHAKEF